ncbi:FecR family protein [uncultured Sanguibacteroides sp.]|uniref:FecR family protein n=1 Tax=uncultured Sanguibacteroides sp. TaxID=1635151 RepID=UPI0025E0305F|nr:FecR family protein [uncultured Sanguibacteroides sp.]
MIKNEQKRPEKSDSINDPFLIARWIAAFLTGELTEEEKGELEAWRKASEKNDDLFERIVDEENRKLKRAQFTSFNKKMGWENYQEKQFRRRQRKFLSRFLPYAAVVMISLSGALYFFINREPDKKVSVAPMNTILPGTPKAILTLADGQKIDLEIMSGAIKTEKEQAFIYNTGQQLTYSDTCLAEISDTVAYNEITVPKCGEYQLSLSDGTLIYLNSMTKIRYPIRFTGETREVELEGEAYFIVAKNTEKPFIVKTTSYDVTVLGTQFNVSAYTDEANVTTTLVQGTVAVSGNKIDRVRRLIPNDQFVLNKTTGQTELKQVDASYSTAWKDGKFRFRDVRLEDIMRAVERWYDVKVIYEDEEVKDFRFGFNMGRHEMIEPLLRIFELNGKIKIQKEGKVLKVKRDR